MITGAVDQRVPVYKEDSQISEIHYGVLTCPSFKWRVLFCQAGPLSKDLCTVSLSGPNLLAAHFVFETPVIVGGFL